MRIKLALFITIISMLFSCMRANGYQNSANNQVVTTAINQSMVIIRNSGSTNTLGWTMAVKRSGQVNIVIENTRNHIRGNLPQTLTERFFLDLDAAMPITDLPQPHCAKSASFGTVTTIYYDGQLSPDVSCPDNDLEKKLYHDLKRMEKLMGLTYLFRYSPNPILALP